MKKIISKGAGIFCLIFLSAVSGCSTKAWVDRPAYWAEKQNQTPLNNFYKVSDSVYRSEKPSREAFQFFEQQKIASVLDLRQKHKDVKLAEGTGLKLFSVPMKSATLTDREIITAMQLIKKAPKPIVVHCAYGSDRTGVTIAMYRIIFQDWTKEEAINEMQHGGFHFHLFHDNLVRYINGADIEQLRSAINATDSIKFDLS